MSKEFAKVIRVLSDENAGGIHTFRVPNTSVDSVVFVKRFFEDLPQVYRNELDQTTFLKTYNTLVNKILIS